MENKSFQLKYPEYQLFFHPSLSDFHQRFLRSGSDVWLVPFDSTLGFRGKLVIYILFYCFPLAIPRTFWILCYDSSYSPLSLSTSLSNFSISFLTFSSFSGSLQFLHPITSDIVNKPLLQSPRYFFSVALNYPLHFTELLRSLHELDKIKC